MRRLSGVLLAYAIVAVPALSHQHGDVYAQTAPQKTTYTGDVVLLAVPVKADKTADYDQVLAKLKEALAKSEAPEAKQQLAGWKVIKNSAPQPDGSVLYVHLISPVVKDADYSIMNNLYSAEKDPAKQKALFDMYSGAVGRPLFIIQGPMVADLSK